MKLLHFPPFQSGRAIAALLMMFALAACLCLPAGEAYAADKPKWLRTTISAWKVVRNTKVTSADKPGYYAIQVTIRHTNRSADRVVTTLYDKRGSFTVTAANRAVRANLKSTKVSRISLDPGQGYKITYTLPFTAKNEGSWRSLYSTLQNYTRKLAKTSYDLKVRASRI